MPKLIPMVVPLTILLTSIMVFGAFAENYEFAAMKSTGISLQRAMRSLAIFIVILGVGTFFFANKVIPWGEYKFYNLRKNIAKVKPALAIAEGQFNDIGNINIKVDEKSGERGEFLKGVIIHEKSTNRTGNFKVIVAEKGELKSSVNSSVLQLELINGNYYEDIINKNPRKNIKKPHARSYFKSYTINVDLEILNNNDFGDENYSNRYNMLDIGELNYTIDSLQTNKREDYNKLAKTLYNRSTYSALKLLVNPEKKDSVYSNEILDLFNTRNKVQILNQALNSANSTKQIINANERNMEKKDIRLNKHVDSFHNKFVLGFACVILFFVGAPLGALIRKGGLGLPIVIAIVLFLTYHFLGIFASNSAEKGSFSPVLGAWASTLVMLPLGIYLTYMATNDRSVFNFDSLWVPFKNLFSKDYNRLSESETKTYNYYKRYDVPKLISIVKEQEHFDLDKKPKAIALQNLLNRKISLSELQRQGLSIPDFIIKAKRIKKDYADYSKANLTSYLIGVVLLVLHFVFKNNKLPQLAEASIQLSILSFIFFGIFLIMSAVYFAEFYRIIKRKHQHLSVIWAFILAPIYPVKLAIFKNKINKDFYQSCLKNIN